MDTIRAVFIVILFILLTLPMMLLQWLMLLFSRLGAQKLPVWYHKQVGKLLGLKLDVRGEVQNHKHPVLLVANHASWLDIVVLSQLAPVSFVAKHEINSWPFFNILARLQQTIFVNRERKSQTHRISNEIMNRLSAGDNVVFFPEGTSSDGNSVLPFKSPLFAAVKPSEKQKKLMTEQGFNFNEHNVKVQTVSIAYTRLSGLPLGRQRRYKVAWVGDAALLPHIWSLLKAGNVGILVKIGKPALLDEFKNRKTLCQHTEQEIKTTVSDLLVNEFNDKA